MGDEFTTFGELKREVIALCRRKGWGDNGIQHPQKIAMAMVVEVSEALEHFIDMENFERAEVAEEIADVMNYALQILYTLDVDISSGFSSDLSDDISPISAVMQHARTDDCGAVARAMRVSVTAGRVLEKFQFLPETKVQEMVRGGLCELRRDIGRAFHVMLNELFALAKILDIDISEQVTRKLAIVDRRIYSSDEPAR